MSKYDSNYIDKEEKAIMEDIEKMDLHKLKSPNKTEQKKIRAAAKQYIEKETKMNIRIDPNELEKIKVQAQKEGLKYQTLVKSVLHKYITGQLVEKK
jgi:predicted DNA binding CopG/RHH family protein